MYFQLKLKDKDGMCNEVLYFILNLFVHFLLQRQVRHLLVYVMTCQLKLELFDLSASRIKTGRTIFYISDLFGSPTPNAYFQNLFLMQLGW